MRIRVVDFETTGTEPPAEVIEVGWCDVIVADGFEAKVGEPRSMLCGVSFVSPETRAIHHIEFDDVAGLNPFSENYFLDDARADGVDLLAAHRAEFESQWMPKISRHHLPILDTWKAALRVFPESPGHSNQTLRYWLADQGLTKLVRETAQPAHRAGPDAYATAWTLAAMLARASVADMLTWAKEPALLPRIPIGKQRGAKWADVEEGFLRWMLRTADMQDDLKWNAQRELDRRAKVSGKTTE